MSLLHKREADGPGSGGEVRTGPSLIALEAERLTPTAEVAKRPNALSQARIVAECWSNFNEFAKPSEWLEALTDELDDLAMAFSFDLPRFE